jgi:hypothetical protein
MIYIAQAALKNECRKEEGQRKELKLLCAIM